MHYNFYDYNQLWIIDLIDNSNKQNFKSIYVSCCKIQIANNISLIYSKMNLHQLCELQLYWIFTWFIFLWWGHKDPKKYQRTRSLIHTTALTEVNQTFIIWSFDILYYLCRQYTCFNNIDHFDYGTNHINVYFSTCKSY